MAKHIIIAVTNDLATDQRVFRVSQTLVEAGYRITLVGRRLAYSPEFKQPYKAKRFKLLFNKGARFYACYNLRLFFYLLCHKFDAVLANDLDTLTASFLASKIKRKILIYDSHEYFTEVPELIGRNFQKNTWLWLEKFMLPKIKHAFTVSPSIAIAYKSKYGTDFKVVRNLPFKREVTKNKRKKVLIYQGALNIGRGIELMIKTMPYLPDYKLWIAGAGDIEENLKELAFVLGLEKQVVFLGRLSMEQLHQKTVQAMLGLSLEENTGLNYYYALPNKLFDYIQAQVPVIVADLPEMRALTEQYGMGEVLMERTPKALASLVNKMAANPESHQTYVEKTRKASVLLNWENEKPAFFNIINQAFETC
ncbi:MAG: glycosyl transferase group 1 [Bacteroidetes bacterium HGW-Bacteroidetes-4]|jgi:glycosyltransferase involved in cell wall biosynthesis|nr:MAG: glycosyl transferase group 1 [Bacteroidetes bacterium HGW-Bacteroidetes-4]